MRYYLWLPTGQLRLRWGAGGSCLEAVGWLWLSAPSLATAFFVPFPAMGTPFSPGSAFSPSLSAGCEVAGADWPARLSAPPGAMPSPTLVQGLAFWPTGAPSEGAVAAAGCPAGPSKAWGISAGFGEASVQEKKINSSPEGADPPPGKRPTNPDPRFQLPFVTQAGPSAQTPR